MSFFRLPIHKIRLPEEDRPQDGSSELLRADPKAKAHSQGVQPPGVLPAHVSIAATSTAATGIVPSWHLSPERRWLKLDLCFSNSIRGCLNMGALKYLCGSLQRHGTVRMWCYILLLEIIFLGLLVPITSEISCVRSGLDPDICIQASLR